jgi:hypothetical protein
MYVAVTLAALGLASAMAGAFGAWFERMTTLQPLAAVPGVLLPLVLQGFVLVLAWVDPAAAGHHHAVRMVALVLTSGAVGGWMLAAWAAVRLWGGATTRSGADGGGGVGEGDVAFQPGRTNRQLGKIQILEKPHSPKPMAPRGTQSRRLATGPRQLQGTDGRT